MLCPKCKNDFDTRFCPNCGFSPETEHTPASAAYQPPPVIINNSYPKASRVYSPKNRWVALLLCFFLGFLGAHRFYTGKVFTGILYLFTMGFFGVGVIVDFITILTGSYTDKGGHFLTSGGIT